MSYNNRQQSLPFAAGADLSSHQYKIVELNSDGTVDISGLRGGFGVLQNIPQSGEAATVCVDGETKVKAGGAIVIGNHIHCVASGGWAGAVASGTLTPVNVIGVALEAVASGGIFTMHMNRYHQASVVSGSILTQPGA